MAIGSIPTFRIPITATNDAAIHVRVKVISVPLWVSVLIEYSFFSRIVVPVARLATSKTTATSLLVSPLTASRVKGQTSNFFDDTAA
jgi:hypothetical protein